MSLLKIRQFSIDQVDTFTFANANVVGNIISGNASLGNLASANFFQGNGSLLTSLTGGNVTGQVSNAALAGTVYTNAQPNITSVGTLSGVTSTGVVDFTGTSNISLGSVSNLHIAGGSSGYVLQTDGSGGLSWHSMTAGTGNANISGSNTQIFFNDNGSTDLGASANLTFDKGTKTLTVDNITANGAGITYIAGANVSGNVTSAVQAHYANIANSVTGSNVSGNVSSATVAYQSNVTANSTSSSSFLLTYVSGTGNSSLYVDSTANDLTYQPSSGNLTAAMFVGNGYYLTSIPASSITGAYSNSNVGDYLPTYTGNVSWAITSNWANTANAVSGSNVSGNVSDAVHAYYADVANSVTGSNVSGNVSWAITSNYANTANAVTWSNVSGTPNTLSGYGITDAYSNTNAGAYLTTYSGELAAANLTITGNLVIGGSTTRVNSTVTTVVDPIFELGGGANGAALSTDDNKDRGLLLHYYTGGATVDAFMGWDDSNVEFVLASNVSVTNEVVTYNTFGNLRLENIYANNANFGGVVFANGNISTAGNFTGNLIGNVQGNVSGTVIVTGGAGALQFANAANALTSSANLNFDASTNTLTANYFSGNGSKLTNITGANVTGYVPNATAANTAGTVTTNAQPNITSVGTLTSLAVSGTTNLGAVGNITITGGGANYFLKTDGSGGLSWSALPSTTISVDTYTGDSSWTMKTLSSTPLNINYTLVAIGGVFQPRDAYDVTGAVITFDDPPPTGAIVEITIINGGTAGSAGYVYQGINSSSTAIAGVRYLVDSSGGAVTLTLPSSASLGDEIGVIDATGSAGTNNITVARNGGKIEGASSDLTVSTNRSAFTLVYYNSTQGWVKTQK